MTETVPETDNLIARLRGEYRIPITDGLGPAGGDEPDNPAEFVRHFQTPPIQHEAATALEAAQARIVELEEEKRASLLGVIAMVLSCGGELRVNPKARQSCQQYNLHAHNDPETGDIVLSARALMEKPNDQP